MSISDGLGQYILCREMEKTRSMKEGMNGKVFFSRLSRHFLFVDNINKVLFPSCTLTKRVNNYVSRQGQGISRRKEITSI